MTSLIVRSGGLGDCLLTLPVSFGIRERDPDGEAHVLGNETMLAVARYSRLFEDRFSLETGGFHSLFSYTPNGFLSSFFAKYDVVYFFSAGDAARLRDTVLSSGARECHVLDPRPPLWWRGHAADYFLTILTDSPSQKPCLQSVLPHIPGSPDGPVLIHPGSGSVKKNWPVERFFAVADRLARPAVFVLGPAERERGFADAILRWGGEIVTPSSLDELAHCLYGTSLYIGNDSGVTHFAALSGIPVIALFGPANHRLWGPRGERTALLTANGGIMEKITVDEVVAVAERLMNV